MASWDLSLLHYVNQVWAAPGLDVFFSIVTDLHKQDWFRFGLIPMLLAFAFYRKKWGAARAAVIIALTIGACDFINHRLVKVAFDRDRPFVSHPDQVTLRLPYQPGGKSFPSNHATNMAVTARLVGAYIPSLSIPLVIYSILVAYSRPYLGVHFPSDVLAGWLLGWMVASLVLFAVNRWLPGWGPKK